MTVFTIPIMFLQCLAWNARDGEVISGFKFEQPVTIMADNGAHVEIRRIEFMAASDYCYPIKVREQ